VQVIPEESAGRANSELAGHASAFELLVTIKAGFLLESGFCDSRSSWIIALRVSFPP
jgi:hypothetical protein